MPLFLTPSTTDPFHNLAVERALFESLAPPGGGGQTPGGRANHALIVWRNDPCVVIGRHQNPWTECDHAAMSAAGVPLVRRISGGGAVYHDPGNLNFSFLGTADTYDLDRHFAVVVSGLASLGITAHRTERNDIRLGVAGSAPGRKISGNAFRHSRGVSLHHGTLLVSADLGRLTTFLTGQPGAADAGAAAVSTPAPAITSSKAIASVRSVVANLSDVVAGLTFDDVAGALRAAYEAEYGEVTAASGVDVTPGDVALYEEELRSWEWRFGRTPRFTARVPVATASAGGVTDVLVTVYHGRVVDVSVAGLRSALVGARFDDGAIGRETW